ncbi:MAG: tRNA (adenosine(37)-N6)-threonylcarbamoyltransferase complex dimerization subunit type 1 TsaB [Bacilli bacterium]|nr:tRNA (adenosine(37)-N6)-threonylcarbamoyltransferase complex dimerization subunit type 1 TsaB [Bacilli bacterium]
MIYLLLDSSNTYLSVGLVKNKQVMDKISYPCFQRQSEYMVMEISKLLKRNHLKMKQINGVVVSIGPGSYTGIRIALTIAKVMSYALNIPLYPLSTLAINQIIDHDSIVLFNARSNRSYIAAFSKNKRLLKDQVMNNDEVKKYLVQHPKFLLVGDLEYLKLKGKKVDVIKNMSLLMNKVKPVKNPNLVKPVYLKESY